MTKKRMSKRMTCRKRYKILKKVAEHHRKVRKELKTKKSKSKKTDPGIPNNFPYKSEILQEYVDSMSSSHTSVRNKNVSQNSAIDNLNLDSNMKNLDLDQPQQQTIFEENQTNYMDIETFMQQAMEKQINYEKSIVDKTNVDFESFKLNDSSYRRFQSELNSVIQQSDVIIQVLDIRDPIGSRSLELENHIFSSDSINPKQMILLLNKIDLVPKKVTMMWLKYFRNEYPTFAFKSSTQTQSSRLGNIKQNLEQVSEKHLKSGSCFGANQLINFLKSYKSNPQSGIVGSMTVGVIGMPNVGKSSVINSIRRERVCQVGGKPGVTRHLQEIKIDSSIRILDSPGVILPNNQNSRNSLFNDVTKADSIYTGASIDLSHDMDYALALQSIIDRCSEQNLTEVLGIPSYQGNLDTFIAHLAKLYGKFKKGGVPDDKAASMIFLNNWRSGKIKYFMVPPENHPSITSHSKITSHFKHSFDSINLSKNEEQEMDELINFLDKGLDINYSTPMNVVPNKQCYENRSTIIVMPSKPKKRPLLS